MRSPARPLAILGALCLLARPAAAASMAGLWRTPAGSVQVSDTADGVVGKLVQPASGCTALAAGAEVLHGSFLDGTFTGELRLCLEGPKCTAQESWLAALLMTNARADQLSGAVERGNDECHAMVPGKGGVKLQKWQPGAKAHDDAQAKIPKAALAEAQGYLAQGKDLLATGQFEAARAVFEKAAKAAPVPEAYNGIGITWYARGQYDDALAGYKQAVAVDPDFGDAYYNMACIYAVSGKKDLAFKFLGMSAKNRYHDISTLDDDDDLKSLHDDPRYAALKKAASK